MGCGRGTTRAFGIICVVLMVLGYGGCRERGEPNALPKTVRAMPERSSDSRDIDRQEGCAAVKSACFLWALEREKDQTDVAVAWGKHSAPMAHGLPGFPTGMERLDEPLFAALAKEFPSICQGVGLDGKVLGQYGVLVICGPILKLESEVCEVVVAISHQRQEGLSGHPWVTVLVLKRSEKRWQVLRTGPTWMG